MASSNSNSNASMSADNDSDDEFLNKDKVVSIVNLLNKYKIKLWEMPTIDGDSQIQSKLESLVFKISDESGVDENEVKITLKRLQKHSIDKLEKNKKFKEQGILYLKLKIIGNNNKIHKKSFNYSIEASVKILGSGLKSYIRDKFMLDCDDLKLICNGKVIMDDLFLESQDLKNHSTLMVLCVYTNPCLETNKTTKDFKLINDIKEAVSLLVENRLRVSKTDVYAKFSLRNQNGTPLELSKKDAQHLTTAMLLHEKARTQMKSNEYIKSLILLAEADNEFKKCVDKNLLEKVDNYALLNLDIVWCYLKLENLHELKNAEERILFCESCLEKCYGKDLERLIMLKTDCSNKHAAIFVRLNLLKVT